MTLDEAIEKLEEIAAEEEREAEAWRACVTLPDGNELENKCKEEAKDLRQLAEWLKELKSYREQGNVVMDEILGIIHSTIYDFMDESCDDEESPLTDKDKLLLSVNKAICNNLKMYWDKQGVEV